MLYSGINRHYINTTLTLASPFFQNNIQTGPARFLVDFHTFSLRTILTPTLLKLCTQSQYLNILAYVIFHMRPGTGNQSPLILQLNLSLLTTRRRCMAHFLRRLPEWGDVCIFFQEWVLHIWYCLEETDNLLKYAWKVCMLCNTFKQNKASGYAHANTACNEKKKR